MNVAIQNIGIIHMGIDGDDQYVLLKCDEDTDADAMHNWLLEQYYHDTNIPGEYFCTSVTIMPHAYAHPGKYIGIVHHRFDV